MITVRAVRSGRAGGAPLADVSDLLDDEATTLLWVDLESPTAEDLEQVREEFALHPLAIEDARKHGQRPKLERYPGHVFLVARSADGAEVDVFIGARWIVTVRSAADGVPPWPADAGVTALAELGERTSPGRVAHALLDGVVDDLLDRTQATAVRLDDIEDRIYADEPEDRIQVQTDVRLLRRELVALERTLGPLAAALDELVRRDVPGVDDEARTYLQDPLDHAGRALDAVHAQRDLLAGALQSHAAILSTRMNEVMKRTSSIGAVLLVSTLIAGIYGMNFQHMPELGWRWGYPMAIGMMATSTAVGLWQLRRRGWL